MDFLEKNLSRVRERIKKAAEQAGRDEKEIQLIAVSKNVDVETLKQAMALGLKCFGENRVQHAEKKIPFLSGASWHLIGPLQSNKVKKAVQLFDFIHAVDTLKILHLIAKESEKKGKRMPVLLEVNVSGEESKHGFAPQEVQDVVREGISLNGIALSGLMTMAPLAATTSEVRQVFRGLADIFRDVQKNYPDLTTWRYLSMGMSGDFEAAIMEGANMVRVGSAIFDPHIQEE